MHMYVVNSVNWNITCKITGTAYFPFQNYVIKYDPFVIISNADNSIKAPQKFLFT